MAALDLERPGRVPVIAYVPPETADELTDHTRAVRMSRSELIRRVLEDLVAAAPTAGSTP